jgi:hypothetical protein
MNKKVKIGFYYGLLIALALYILNTFIRRSFSAYLKTQELSVINNDFFIVLLEPVRNFITSTFLYLGLHGYYFLLIDSWIVFSLIVFFYVQRKNKEIYKIPYILVLLSFIQLIRNFTMILTPMNQASLYYMNPYYHDYGMFFSGHIIPTFLFFLIAKGKSKYFHLLCTFMIMFFMLSLYWHYTIDFIGAIAITYALYILSEKYVRKYFY